MRVIVTGVTGMVGEGVLLECLESRSSVGRAMLQCVKAGAPKPVLEIADIAELARAYDA